MGKQRQEIGNLVVSYLEEWGNLPTRTLALKIYSDHKHMFPGEELKAVDKIRATVRYYRGTCGGDNRKCAPKTFFQNKYELPPSDEADWFPFVLPKFCNNILFLSDIHLPYQSNEALEVALEYGVKKDINTVFLNGDVMDCYQGSSFVRDPRKRDLAEELEICRNFLDVLKKVFPNAYIFYKMGNHEERWERFLMTKAPELLNVNEFRLDVLLRFGEKSIHTQTISKQIVQAGKLTLLHGHEFGGTYRSPVNPARGLFLKAKKSAIAGHHHQTSEHTETDIHGEVSTCWSVGCLSELHPEYMVLNKWNHGFAHIEIEENGNFRVDNLRIIDNKIV